MERGGVTVPEKQGRPKKNKKKRKKSTYSSVERDSRACEMVRVAEEGC